MKQIVGGTLNESGADTNFVSDRPASWYAELYRRDELRGGHVIQLGAGNETAAREALAAYPGGLQIGGGINLENAAGWLDAGASHVIVTSWVFVKAGWMRIDCRPWFRRSARNGSCWIFHAGCAVAGIGW